MLTEERIKLVAPVFDTIKNEDIKEFGLVLLGNLPEYIWSVPASSTGKYHPQYSLGEGGLMRHQIAVVKFLNFFFELEQYNTKMTDREMDLMRVAGLVHDGMKSGTQEDFEKSKYTKFDHPMKMAKMILSYDGQYLNHEEIEFMAKVVAKHMGQWNEDSKSGAVLPKPNERFSRMLHVADYLSSRKCITIDFDMPLPAPALSAVEKPDLDTFIIPFGKRHKGKLLIDVAKHDPTYINWMRQNLDREPYISLIKELDARNSQSE